MEAVSVHLRKVDSRVLARGSEDCHGQEVGETLTGIEGRGDVYTRASIRLGWVAVVMEITGPALYFIVLTKKRLLYR